MKLLVKVKPNAREEMVEMVDETHLRVSVKAAPEKGRANEALVGILAKHFKVYRSYIRILRGKTSREKVIEILS